MRSRARLIEVLDSVNGDAVGVWPFHAWLCRYAADALGAPERDNTAIEIANMKMLSRHHAASPHIRELATEALFYLNEDANG